MKRIRDTKLLTFYDLVKELQLCIAVITACFALAFGLFRRGDTEMCLICIGLGAGVALALLISMYVYSELKDAEPAEEEGEAAPS